MKFMSTIKYILLLFTGVTLNQNTYAATSAAFNSDSSVVFSIEQLAEVEVKELRSFMQAIGQTAIAEKLKYDVTSQRLVYETIFKGKIVKASGLVLLPKDLKSKAPIISIQHGTTFSHDGAPSEGAYTGMELFASAGYIVLMPDYLGYGESESLFHPYYDRQYSALAVIDMIKAAKAYLQGKSIPFSDKLFLAGYSEGGYVTLAAAREIDTNKEHNLTVTAVAAGAGGYDVVEMLKGVATNSYYSYPGYLAFVLMSYNSTYDWRRPLSDFFRPKYAEALSKYMNGEYEGGFINSRLTTDTKLLFNETFYSKLKQSAEETALKQAVQKNSVTGWKTTIPIRLYHGTKDEIIPVGNSEATFKSFKTAGSESVELILIPGGTHGSSFRPMLDSFIPWLMNFN
jgi:dipeptidyl aminopeptidase/acylaminoacyl peptidase